MPKIKLLKRKPRQKNVNKDAYQYIYQDKQWKRLRKRKFGANPICEVCAAKIPMVVRPTKEVHHIVPFEIAGEDEEQMFILAFDYDNLISLCIECHKKAHVELQKSYKGKQKIIK